MNAENAMNILDAIILIMFFGIVVVYSFASYWNIKFLISAKKRHYTWIKIYTAIMCIIFIFLYGYSFVDTLLGKTTDFSLFYIGFVVPSVFLMGGALASSARARYLSLLSGGEDWTLRKT